MQRRQLAALRMGGRKTRRLWHDEVWGPSRGASRMGLQLQGNDGRPAAAAAITWGAASARTPLVNILMLEEQQGKTRQAGRGGAGRGGAGKGAVTTPVHAEARERV